MTKPNHTPEQLHEFADLARDQANRYPAGSPERVRWAKLSLDLINQSIEMEEKQ